MADRELTVEERDKFVAEAARMRKDAEKIDMEIELAKIDMDLAKAALIEKQQEILKLQAEVSEAQNRAEVTELETQTRKRAFEELMASNRYHYVYRFSDEVNDATVEHCIERLTIWHRSDPKCDIEVIFNSPGGSAIAGMELFDFMMDLRKQGHKITTGARGMAASMASILLQAGEVRWIGRHATLLIHQPAGVVHGKTDDMQDQMEWLNNIQEQAVTIYADRCADAAKNGTATEAKSSDDIKRGWKRKDWYVNADDAVRFGFVDSIKG